MNIQVRMDFNLDFNSQSPSDWLKLWLKESGGKQPEEFVKTLDRGVEIKPYYHFSEKITHQYSSSATYETAVSEWIDFPEETDKQLNTLILKALNSGASGLYLNIYNQPQWEVVLKEVGLEYIYTTVDFRSGFLKEYTRLEAFLSLTRNENSAKKVHVVLPWLRDDEKFREVLQGLETDFHGILIDLAEPLEAGLPPGFVLALGMEMLNAIWQSKPHLLKRVGFLSAVVGSTFQDLIFNRALKILAGTWMKKAQIQTGDLFIHTRTGRIDMGTTDVFNNLIRNSIKTLSALISGTNAVSVLPYNFFKTTTDHNALRWARNQALIAIYESKVNYYSDPSAGSYTLESIRQQLIEAAIYYHHQIQHFSSFSQLFTSGYFADVLSEGRKNLLEEYQQGKKIMVGVSKYRPENETAEELEVAFREGSPFEPFVIQNHLV